MNQARFSAIGGAGLVAALAMVNLACGAGDGGTSREPAAVPASGPIVLALTGDTLLTSRAIPSRSDVQRALDLVQSATLGFTNLENAWLDEPLAASAETRPLPRPPFARADDALVLRRIGFDLASLANNRTLDYGAGGFQSTAGALDAIGLLYAGAGRDLDAAQRPAFAGRGTRRVALVAVTTSASPDQIASASQGDIRGRPGVSALRYTADITADAATFRTLKESVQSLNAGPPPTDDELVLFGTRVRRGERTAVDFVVNDADERLILDRIRAARAEAELVVLSIHSHEPSNFDPQPVDLVRRLAHAAIDAGATVVVGHGPHRLRPAEAYGGGVVFYSLGNFIYPAAAADLRAADAFDAGRNLLSEAIGALAVTPAPLTQIEQAWWWESVAVRVSADPGGRLTARIYPLDLGTDPSTPERGWPRWAGGERGSAILRQFSTLSGLGHLPVAQQDGGPVLEWPIPQLR